MDFTPDPISPSTMARWQSVPAHHAPGLTDTEVERVEGMYGLEFPSDLRQLLQGSLPTGSGWPDWRQPEACRDQIAWPLRGIEFDIEHNTLWLPEFGMRPEDLAGAQHIVREHVERAPVLIPIYGHRYILCGRWCAQESPILSVHQADIIPYGLNLTDWLEIEFGQATHHSDLPPDIDLGLWERIMKYDE